MQQILVAIGFALLGSSPVCADNQPNIVLFLADDLGWTGLRCFGSDFYETPNLDLLAKKGTKFTHAYSACTVCSPSRAALLTGMYPARLHLTDFIAGQDRPYARMKVPDWIKGLGGSYYTIAEALKDADYRTAHFGKWHLNARDGTSEGMLPNDQGFDISAEGPPRKGYVVKEGHESIAGTNFLTDVLTDKACEFIDDAHEKPFFLYFAYHVPHTPIQGREDLVEYFNAKVDKKKKHRNPNYAAMVKSMDESVGRVLDQLDKHRIADNTLVIFTSDNGGLTHRFGKHDGFTENLPLRRGKGSAFEGGVRVPTIVHWPGITPAGTVCETPIMSTDFYPTFLEVAGTAGDQQHNADVDGQSIVPLLRDPSHQFERDLFWHYPHYHAGGVGPFSAIRSGSFRLVEFLGAQNVQLFDLSLDESERKDLSSTNPGMTQELLTRLNDWRISVDAQMPTLNPDFDRKRQLEVVKPIRKKETVK